MSSLREEGVVMHCPYIIWFALGWLTGYCLKRAGCDLKRVLDTISDLFFRIPPLEYLALVVIYLQCHRKIKKQKCFNINHSLSIMYVYMNRLMNTRLRKSILHKTIILCEKHKDDIIFQQVKSSQDDDWEI